MDIVIDIAAAPDLRHLVDKVAAGETIAITRDGRTVAYLTSPAKVAGDVDAVIAALRAARRGRTLGGGLRALIEDGRA